MDLSAVKSVFSNFPDGNIIGENNSVESTTEHPDEEEVQSSKEEISEGGSSLRISDSQISGESLKVMPGGAGDHKSFQEIEAEFGEDCLRIKEK